MICER